MIKSKKTFPFPYIGFDSYDNYDAIINTRGSSIVSIRIKNIAVALSSDEMQYKNYHSCMDNVIKTLGGGYQMQKLDIFARTKYEAETSENYLQKKYSEHFDGRSYKVIETILSICHYNEDNKAVVNLTNKEENELHARLDKVFLILSQYGFEPEYLFADGYENYLASILTADFDSKTVSYDNVLSTKTNIHFGDKVGTVLDFVDTQTMDLPNTISPYTKMGGNTVFKNTIVDNFSFLNNLNDYELIVYNQVIAIPNQTKRKKKLEAKKRRHESMSSDSENATSANDIIEMFDDLAKTSSIIVDAHFSLLVVCQNDTALRETTSIIESSLFELGIYIGKNSYNQFELFSSFLLGNLDSIKDYNYFTTSSETACCFFFKEKYPVSEDSNFYLRFCDRQGVPLRIDVADLPMKTNRINNRNKFVLGPSGSGKSFLMNNIVEQYLVNNYDVVIVDVGDSYSGIADYFGAKYIKYEEESPITMNPFLIEPAQFNIEYLEFLSDLVLAIWKGTSIVPTTTEKAVIDNLINSYYHLYFNRNNEWWDSESNENLLRYLKRFNYDIPKIIDVENDFNYVGKDFYGVLKVTLEATENEIENSFKSLSGSDISNYELSKAKEAYKVLIDKEKRLKYDLVYKAENSNSSIIVGKNSFYSSNEFRHLLLFAVKKVKEEMHIENLKFNSFYDYASLFLPKYLAQIEYNLKEHHFDLGNFLFILSDFYIGGRYEPILNEQADSSLFEENFIVFEIDNVKDNPTLFPLVTLIIMNVFIQKMRLRSHKRKALILEEAWKAIANKMMANNLVYLFKTVRKFWGEVIVVTQELGDILGNAIVKDSIINNSDTYILLDQSKFADNFDDLASLLALNETEKAKILTINQLDNKYGRSYFKEFYIKRGSSGEVYGTEVSIEQYFSYTTEKPEKMAVGIYKEVNGNYEKTLDNLIVDFKKLKQSPSIFCEFVNLIQRPVGEKDISLYNKFKKNGIPNVVKHIKTNSIDQNIKYENFLNSNLV